MSTATPQSDEDELRIPPEWAGHLDGRPGGRLTLERVEQVMTDPYAQITEAGLEQTIVDRIDASYTYVAVLGPAALPQLEDLAPIGGWMDAAEQRAAAEAMSVIPTDEAFTALFLRATQAKSQNRFGQGQGAPRNERYFSSALDEAMTRFPRRATRVLSEFALGRGYQAERGAALLDVVVRRSADASRAESGSLPASARGRVEELLTRLAERREANHTQLPAVLQQPPWDRPRKSRPRRKRVDTLTLERLAHGPSMVWLGDERERWAEDFGPHTHHIQMRISSIAAGSGWEKASRSGDEYTIGGLIVWGPTDVARAGLPRWLGTVPDGAHALEHLAQAFMAPVAARFGLEALHAIRRVASSKGGHRFLLPFGDPGLAPVLARAALTQGGRDVGEAWLRRHPEAAAIGLIPEYFSGDAKRRKAAASALSLLVTGGARETLGQVAGRYGEAASAGLLDLLDRDPLEDYPARLPTMPAFWDPVVLEPPELEGGGSLDPRALDTLGTMLAISRPGAVYAGVARVVDACTRESLARFAWSLFEAWQRGGAESKHKWAFLQLGWLGDDGVAHRLAHLMADWPRQGAAKRAELGLDVLAEMPSDVALMLVHGMADRARSRSLKKNARKKLSAIAARRGLSADELSDRLVPTLELDERGSLRLDFGPRAFRVAFDEKLAPLVLEESGRHRKSLPKPAKSDDAALAASATRRFKDLRKSVRAIATTQIGRLESAMCRQRRYRADDFRNLVVGHPLLIHLARRLVWAQYPSITSAPTPGARPLTFRVTEDGTFADEQDETFVLDPELLLGVVHLVEIDAHLARAWGDVFADYQILQPFDQLSRDVSVVAPAAREPVLNEALAGKVETTRIRGLESRGWQRGAVEDGGVWCVISRDLGHGWTAELALEEGVHAGGGDLHERQHIHALLLRRGGAEASASDLSPIAFSELLQDLHSLR